MTAPGRDGARPDDGAGRGGASRDDGAGRGSRATAIHTAVGFARTLRAAGVGASPDRVQAFLAALAVLDPRRRDHVYDAGRATLCGSLDDLDRYGRVFAAYFAGEAPHRRPRRLPSPPVVLPDVLSTDEGGGAAADDDDPVPVRSVASATEVLRQKDFAALSPRERGEVARLLTALRLPGELRRTRRHRPARRGRVDRHATVRALLQAGGEARLRRERVRPKPRRVVLLVDVSGSMSAYADGLLHFAHATARRGDAAGLAGVGAGGTLVAPEVFTVGTRLTHVTRELSHRDPDAAMAAVSRSVPDWSGGTRLGELVKEFLDRWGQRGMARGAVVVVLSDGWERGDAALLGEQMARLRRLAHRVVWSNPRRARPGFAPVAAGMAAALPHVDDFVEGHSVAALEHLAAVVAGRVAGPARVGAGPVPPVGVDAEGKMGGTGRGAGGRV